uniref:Putative secreted protein n=1 Tax=Anopheles triannulatus TaxID=58253 RepID=A0A2M4B4L9_9DIPT
MFLPLSLFHSTVCLFRSLSFSCSLSLISRFPCASIMSNPKRFARILQLFSCLAMKKIYCCMFGRHYGGILLPEQKTGL